MAKLHVIAVISNPLRWQSRLRLFKEFEARMLKSPNVELHVVELAFGNRKFVATDKHNQNHTQLRTYDEWWHKENLINIGISKLPRNWKYVAWIDADVEFLNKNFARECIAQLQHYQVIQMFSHALDLGPGMENVQTHNGFVWSYLTGKPRPKKGYPYAHWHSGYAWAARREAIDYLGGLYDVSFGSGDHLMAWALLNDGVRHLNGQSPGYIESLADWQRRAEKFIKRDIGFMNGTILHHWHGRKVDRQYTSRYLTLKKYQFDPYTDLKKDWQGVYTLDIGADPKNDDTRLIEFRDEIRKYFRHRWEDSTDLE